MSSSCSTSSPTLGVFSLVHFSHFYETEGNKNSFEFTTEVEIIQIAIYNLGISKLAYSLMNIENLNSVALYFIIFIIFNHLYLFMTPTDVFIGDVYVKCWCICMNIFLTVSTFLVCNNVGTILSFIIPISLKNQAFIIASNWKYLYN